MNSNNIFYKTIFKKDVLLGVCSHHSTCGSVSTIYCVDNEHSISNMSEASAVFTFHGFKWIRYIDASNVARLGFLFFGLFCSVRTMAKKRLTAVAFAMETIILCSIKPHFLIAAIGQYRLSWSVPFHNNHRSDPLQIKYINMSIKPCPLLKCHLNNNILVECLKCKVWSHARQRPSWHQRGPLSHRGWQSNCQSCWQMPLAYRLAHLNKPRLLDEWLWWWGGGSGEAAATQLFLLLWAYKPIKAHCSLTFVSMSL